MVVVTGEPPQLLVFVQPPVVNGKTKPPVIRELAIVFELHECDFSKVHSKFATNKLLKVNGEITELAKGLD